MARNWNTIWRYIHLTLGLVLVAYHARIAYYHQGMFGVTTLWSPETDEFISTCLLYTSPSPRDRSISRMPSSA